MVWTPAKLLQRLDWAPGLATFRFDLELEPFVAGQWVNIAVSAGGERVKRAYSLASAPGAQPEFFVTEVADGAVSPRLFALQPGDGLEVESKAQGFFTLDYVPDAEQLWLVATGTGLGPFVSMLRAGQVFERFSRVVVVHGVRKAAHLAYASELRDAGADRCRVSYVPVVSRDPDEGGVLHGRVTTALSSGQLEDRAGVQIAADKSHLMLCGNPDMIHDLMELLKQRGLQRHRVRKPGQITTEKYW